MEVDMSNNHYNHHNYPQVPHYSTTSGTNFSDHGGFGVAHSQSSSSVHPSQPNRNTLPNTSTESNSTSSNHVAPVMPTIPERKKAAKTDDLEAYKDEIIRRLRDGETGRAIALDLVSRGVNTTEAGLGHRRLKWGIRMRELHPPSGKRTASPTGGHPTARTAGMRSIWLPGGVAGEDYETRALGAVQGLGLDSATADLLEKPVRMVPPAGWKYPHRTGGGTRSNLDDFKDLIIEKTRGGASLDEIANHLMAMGVQTSDRAVGRKRLLWGLRQRKSRHNLKNPPIDVTGTSTRKFDRAYHKSHPAKAQIMRRLEITRMTKEGMSAEQIVDHLESRGVVWKKGATSVLRLQSRWGLLSPEENPRHASNKIAQISKAVRAEQRAAFHQIAQELDIENVNDWVEMKMREYNSRETRSKLARERLEQQAPELIGMGGRPKHPTATSKEPNPKQRQASEDEDSDDSDESSSESESETGDSSSSSESGGGSLQPTESHVVDQAASNSRDGQDSSLGTENHSADQTHATAMDVDTPASREAEQDQEDDPDSAENVAARIFARIGKDMPKATGSAPKPIPLYPVRGSPRRNMSAGAGSSRGRPGLRSHPSVAAAPAMPKAAAASPRLQPISAAPAEDDDMGCYDDGGLGAPASRDSTPVSASPATPSQGPAWRQPPSGQQQHNQPSTIPQATPQQAPYLLSSILMDVTPVLKVRPEEAEANNSMLGVVEQYTAAAQKVKDMVLARTENRALPGSITGLPPSLKDVDAAKQSLKAAAHAMYTSL